ncbi:MAG: ACT domain-containing protein, partial [Isosphaeraceae bacterium]
HIDGTLLIFTHKDRPGLIGFIGRTLGDEGVNIAQMNVGREEQGGEAIGVVNLDSVPSAQALETVRQHPDILSLSVIKLPPLGAVPAWLGSW